MSDDDEVCTRTATASDGEGTRAGESGAIAALGETKTSRLMELEARLAEKDFIMEPSAIDDVRAYVSAGGAPSTAIELLSENYRGYAAMTTLAVHWLKVTAPPRRGANTSPIKVSAAVETRGIDNGDGDATRTPTGGILTSGAGKGTPRERAATMETEARFDEMYFLEALVREKFDANKADAVFQGRPPAWLDGLFKSERGRAVLFSLAESNPNCLLISCAIQHAWQRGMRHEVRALGPAAAAYFSIFHELLADHVKGIIEAGDDDERRMDFEERLKSMCCQSIGTYVFGQLMLATLGRDTDKATTKSSQAIAARLSEEIEEAAASLHGAATVRRLAPWLAASAADATAKYATADLLSSRPVGTNTSSVGQIRDSGALAAGDLKKLLDLYVSSDVKKKPSVAPLRHPNVLYNLISEAFKWTVDSGANRLRSECFELIALAASDDETSVDEVKAALTEAVAIVENAKRGEMPEQTSVDKVFAIPCATAGIIAAARSALTNEMYHRVVQVGNANSVFVHVLGEVAKKHIGLQGVVLEALNAIIQSCGSSHGAELAISLLDLGCELVAAGHVMPTITAAANSWRRTLDPSQIRYFANEVLEIAGPPYSRDFAVVMIRLLDSANSRKRMSKTVDDFVEDVRVNRRSFHPPLSLAEVGVLDSLSR